MNFRKCVPLIDLPIASKGETIEVGQKGVRSITVALYFDTLVQIDVGTGGTLVVPSAHIAYLE